MSREGLISSSGSPGPLFVEACWAVILLADGLEGSMVEVTLNILNKYMILGRVFDRESLVRSVREEFMTPRSLLPCIPGLCTFGNWTGTPDPRSFPVRWTLIQNYCLGGTRVSHRCRGWIYNFVAH
jgi:hypothetical protein